MIQADFELEKLLYALMQSSDESGSQKAIQSSPFQSGLSAYKQNQPASTAPASSTFFEA